MEINEDYLIAVEILKNVEPKLIEHLEKHKSKLSKVFNQKNYITIDNNGYTIISEKWPWIDNANKIRYPGWSFCIGYIDPEHLLNTKKRCITITLRSAYEEDTEISMIDWARCEKSIPLKYKLKHKLSI